MKSPRIIFLAVMFFGLAIAVMAGLDFVDFDARANISSVIARGSSLEPILSSGDELNIDTKYFQIYGIAREDIVLYEYAKSRNPIVKIVKGVPGDTFQLQEAGGGKYYIVVNQSILTNSEKEPYMIEGKKVDMISIYQRQYNGLIPENLYLLLGNKVGGTFDSTAIGLVSSNGILGRVALDK